MAATAAIRAIALQAPKGIIVRNFKHQTLVSGPPRVRIPFREKILHGLFIACAVTATPAWILVHLKEYRDWNK